MISTIEKDIIKSAGKDNFHSVPKKRLKSVFISVPQSSLAEILVLANRANEIVGDHLEVRAVQKPYLSTTLDLARSNIQLQLALSEHWEAHGDGNLMHKTVISALNKLVEKDIQFENLAYQYN